ncbi:hypothetical protein OU682_21835 [Paracoccus sp. EF6]|uniref:Uncharacterized protein n=1 Tax=Paracoccus benzoatiresistens TaxID=2997341 RepID=A0ABT4JAR2_9RHOB|nr:hypothetical protein [Paracoccus sp. EF6]MCZ0964218.1 hypothetical protein [Paracoccus sp. EF6]
MTGCDCVHDLPVLIAVTGLERRRRKPAIAAIPAPLPWGMATCVRQPGHHPYHGRIARHARDRMMKVAVRPFAIGDPLRATPGLDQPLQFCDVRGIGPPGCLRRNWRFQKKTGADQIGRRGIGGKHCATQGKAARRWSDKCPLPDVPPDQALALQGGEARAQGLPAAAEAAGQGTLGWQAVARRQSANKILQG